MTAHGESGARERAAVSEFTPEEVDRRIAWMSDASREVLLRGWQRSDRETVPQAIERLCLGDSNLTRENASKLARIFKAAYESLVDGAA